MKRNTINTRAGKRAFIRSLCGSIEVAVLAAVPQMPADWDGHELRELIAEVFNSERTRLMKESRGRMRNYRSARYNITKV